MAVVPKTNIHMYSHAHCNPLQGQYRASTGPEQGFPHREKPVFISWDPWNENRFFPVGNSTQGKPCSHYRDGFAVQQCNGNCYFLLMFQPMAAQL